MDSITYFMDVISSHYWEDPYGVDSNDIRQTVLRQRVTLRFAEFAQ